MRNDAVEYCQFDRSNESLFSNELASSKTDTGSASIVVRLTSKAIPATGTLVMKTLIMNKARSERQSR